MGKKLKAIYLIFNNFKVNIFVKVLSIVTILIICIPTIRLYRQYEMNKYTAKKFEIQMSSVNLRAIDKSTNKTYLESQLDTIPRYPQNCYFTYTIIKKNIYTRLTSILKTGLPPNTN